MARPALNEVRVCTAHGRIDVHTVKEMFRVRLFYEHASQQSRATTLKKPKAGADGNKDFNQTLATFCPSRI
jgi:hypothetical protein